MAERLTMLPLAAKEPLMTPINSGPLPPELQQKLERHGITTVPKSVYEWGGFRYSNASDAIAAAERATR